MNERAGGITTMPPNDPYGARSIEGAVDIYTNRRVSKWRTARNAFRHRTKNGLYDPFTYFHLVSELATVTPGTSFTSAELAAHLNEARADFQWDAVTVGRILNDLASSWRDSNGADTLSADRTWAGTTYETAAAPESRAAIANLIDDLETMGLATLSAVKTGRPWRDLVSPLASCASVVAVAA